MSKKKGDPLKRSIHVDFMVRAGRTNKRVGRQAHRKREGERLREMGERGRNRGRVG